MIGSLVPTAAGPAGAPGPARSSGGHDVQRLLKVPFADPGFYSEDRTRFIYATGHDLATGRAFRVSRYDPETQKYGVPRPSMLQRPKWVGPRGSRHDRGEVHMWGPHVWKRSVDGPRDYVMYFSGSRRGGSDCIGMAVAESPMGPFVPKPRPMRCTDRGATLIDPAYFRTGGGVHYLIYKRHHYAPMAVGIWAIRVRADGSRRPGSRPFQLIDGGRRQIEAPSVVARHGRIYLFTSRLRYSTCEYKTVVFVAGALRRPFRSLGMLTLRRRDGRRFCGPGGAEVRFAQGTFRMVFHAFDKNPERYPAAPRFVWGGRLRWTDDGRPYAAPAPSPSRFVPRATVNSRTNSGSSSRSPYSSRS
ncbi:MAG TPA: family 43 glycosylhydrolase [Nocardioides sp.]|nr:family 43 glycosylhydrolase [Nocardioides sp.]